MSGTLESTYSPHGKSLFESLKEMHPEFCNGLQATGSLPSSLSNQEENLQKLWSWVARWFDGS